MNPAQTKEMLAKELVYLHHTLVESRNHTKLIDQLYSTVKVETTRPCCRVRKFIVRSYFDFIYKIRNRSRVDHFKFLIRQVVKRTKEASKLINDEPTKNIDA